MGIYDRDYYRKEGPSVLDAFAVKGQMVKWLLAINIAMFVVQLLTREHGLPPGFPPEMREAFREAIRNAPRDQLRMLPRLHSPVTDALLLDTDKVLHGEVWRLVTYAFLHDTFGQNFWLHIV